ncbi:lipopolysaccharide biosynthesis protein [Enterococcus gilvus]|uniref:lipopolysaccharide biosynthesis protein n=1 Tax=Enterococcus gilvus TaxID=160453 RepID=UPI003EDA0145
MKNKSRMQYSLLNSSVSAVIYILNIAIKFLSRSFFIHFLGAEYLGLNGLFTNILSMLSLAELGIGTSIVYSLYSPLAKGNEEMINALMRLYKKIYTVIGVAVGLLGILLIPVLPHIIGDAQNISGIYLIYMLFLLNSVSSYFFTYNRSLLIADQKSYITVIFDFLCSVVVTIIQIASLYLLNNYFVYLSIQILGTIVTNLFLTYNVKKLYPFLSNKSAITHLDEKTKDTLKRNTIGNLSSKIGSVVVSGTDNIFISSFVGIGTVGLYSNYILIINSIRGLCGQITNSITSSIGNVGVDANDELSKRVFERHNFVNFTLTFFSSVVLVSTINPFIALWVGSDYELEPNTVFLIISNFIILMLRNSSIVFIDAFGLAWQQRWKSVIEAITNISLSFLFLLVFKMGINGVLLATTLSSLMTVCWIEPYVVYKYGLHSNIVNYLKIIIKQIFSLLFALSLAHILLVDRFEINFVGLILYGGFGFLLSLIVFLIFYVRSPEFIFLFSVLRNILRERLKK